MKKVLWCGGSHMGNLRSAIFSSHEAKALVQNYKNTFFPTAGGEVWAWIEAGGRLKEYDDGRVQYRRSPNPVLPSGEPDYGEIFDLNEFDAVVFVGQWFRPLQYFGMTDWFKCGPPLSLEARKILFENVIENPFVPGSGSQQISNEPFIRFPFLMTCPERLIVMPDPLPMHPPAQEISVRPANYREAFQCYQKNIELVKSYYSTLKDLCAEKGIQYCFQPESSFDSKTMTTDSIYAANEDERIHVNINFYTKVLKNLLCPAIDKLSLR